MMMSAGNVLHRGMNELLSFGKTDNIMLSIICPIMLTFWNLKSMVLNFQ